MSSILKFLRENHILALIEQAISKKKSRLCLNSFEIYEIPELLYTCLTIEHLYLHRNKISVIPVQICQLLNLTTLTLDYNNITSLPAEIGTLKNLVNLNLSYNPLGKLIPEIGDLENLEAFWCNRIELQEIPVEMAKLEKLDTFGARGNQIRPSSIVTFGTTTSRSSRPLCYGALRSSDIDMDNSSIDSSEDWENSVNSSELDVQYQSDEERIDNEVCMPR
ncbi:Leucine-rich repeat-containing protein [Operophtera brumata]|uniref:Leucine-rich repeat-containing protein n=1 Tax=Operophtera brumata TaxID=104452 RepID=A0A0L7KJJ3_OPEBR|nr:Leucine-rich repeat-containing protein [Operophtera brumata]